MSTRPHVRSQCYSYVQGENRILDRMTDTEKHRMGGRQHPCLRPSFGVTPSPTVPFHSGMARVFSIQLLMFRSIALNTIGVQKEEMPASPLLFTNQVTFGEPQKGIMITSTKSGL